MKKIVCLGDSITWGFDSNFKFSNIHQVEIPYPQRLQNNLGGEFEVINSGNSGWQARGTLQKLQELVFDYQPSTVILMLGINDARGSKQGLPVSQKRYYQGMKSIITSIQDQGINVVLLGPTPVFHFRVAKFNQRAHELASELNIPFVDLHHLIYKQLADDNLELKDILKDHIHLSQDYYLKLGDIVYNQVKDLL